MCFAVAVNCRENFVPTAVASGRPRWRINPMNINYNLHDINRHYQDRWARASWVPVVSDAPRVASVTNGSDKGATTPAQVHATRRAYEQVLLI
jgi:hypothetical protein